MIDTWLDDAIDLSKRWASALGQSQRWFKWVSESERASLLGLNPLIEAVAKGSILPRLMLEAVDIGYARWYADAIVSADPHLRSFLAEHHEAAIESFGKLDEKVALLARDLIIARLSGQVPGRTAFGRDAEWGILAHEIEKKSRHIPLRKLFAQMPKALRTLAPCMMMSPLLIAQYLPAETKPFDVVIFDEASQIPVWDAIGAIARGSQMIVAGDSKQLPPTSFFERNADGDDDDNEYADLESILDECRAANVPTQRLDWHYRSRHESLITFSNKRYYDDRLITFPSPVITDNAVSLIEVVDGVYDRGASRTNIIEARRVVADVITRLRDPLFKNDNLSLGVVSFNTEQQRLIEKLLDESRSSYPEIEPFFHRDWHEPVFVKNLESVQGDEREIILFSVGYGRDDSGRMTQNFGTLNQKGGERRLNVAITRARSKMVVYTSFSPDAIDLSGKKLDGLRHFKEFLAYAQHGIRAFAEAASPTGRGTDSPFEDAVMVALEARGWKVHPQVGASGYRIDLGVIDPKNPGRYIAGVECDGASYHSAATARDRDRLREQVLRGLGWRIHRVWSTDLFVDQDRALARLQASLEESLAAQQAADEAAAQRIQVNEGSLADEDVPLPERMPIPEPEPKGGPWCG